MKYSPSTAAFLGALLAASTVDTAPAPATGVEARDVDTRFPYAGPVVAVGDFVDNTINGNGKGFSRLVELPAVKPANSKANNNINVISTSYVPRGMNVHFQTPFGLGTAPTVHWGLSPKNLCNTTRGQTQTYDRTPPCSEIAVITQCSQYFHDVQLTNLKSFTKYYYKIEAANGTTASQILEFTTARAAGDDGPFNVAVLNDMGYTNAQGTHAQLIAAADKDVAFAWHGGDISYADNWYTGFLPCEEDHGCYNGTSSRFPPGDLPADYFKPLPKGEVANRGSPRGGDISVIYESNWDLWQQWMSKVTLKMPYMTLPGNHEAACAEFDGPGNILTAYLNEDKANSTAPDKTLTYYTCPPSQRNFTAYQHRFRMPGAESGGVGNMWYSFDYGMVHFISLDGETDFAYSPEKPFLRDLKGDETLPIKNETYITDSGPFGYIKNNDWKNNQAYEQIQWLSKDLASVNRQRTPWIIAMSHRPMYSSEVVAYQKDIRAAFEPLLLQHGVDAYLSGHIHWYERMYPLGNGTINKAAIVNNNTYLTAPGKSIAHIVNGMAGNIESHDTLEESKMLDITAVLDQMHYGFSKLKVESAEKITFEFIRGDGEGVGDHLTLVKVGSATARQYGV